MGSSTTEDAACRPGGDPTALGEWGFSALGRPLWRLRFCPRWVREAPRESRDRCGRGGRGGRPWLAKDFHVQEGPMGTSHQRKPFGAQLQSKV